jgi:hypothetical protein
MLLNSSISVVLICVLPSDQSKRSHFGKVEKNCQICLRFKIFTTVTILVVFFWGRSPCRLVVEADVSEKLAVSAPNFSTEYDATRRLNPREHNQYQNYCLLFFVA